MVSDTLKRAMVFRDRLRLLMKKEERYSHMEPRGTLVDPELAKKRTQRNLQVTEMAALAGVSRSTMQVWLSPNSNDPRLPQTNNLQKLAEACGVSVNWLLGEDDAPTTDAKQGASFVLEEFGINFNSYCVLKKLKEQGRDLNELLMGFNTLLSNPFIFDVEDEEEEWEEDEKDENSEEAEVEESNPKTNYYVTVLDCLNRYFENKKIKQGMYIALPYVGVRIHTARKKPLESTWVEDTGIMLNPVAIEEYNLSLLTNAIRDIRKSQIKKEYFRHKENGTYEKKNSDEYIEADSIRKLYLHYYPEERPKK